jgi:hypothetical protein
MCEEWRYQRGNQNSEKIQHNGQNEYMMIWSILFYVNRIDHSLQSSLVPCLCSCQCTCRCILILVTRIYLCLVEVINSYGNVSTISHLLHWYVAAWEIWVLCERPYVRSTKANGDCKNINMVLNCFASYDQSDWRKRELIISSYIHFGHYEPSTRHKYIRVTKINIHLHVHCIWYSN